MEKFSSVSLHGHPLHHGVSSMIIHESWISFRYHGKILGVTHELWMNHAWKAMTCKPGSSVQIQTAFVFIDR